MSDFRKLMRIRRQKQARVESLQREIQELTREIERLRLTQQTPPPYYDRYLNLPEYLRREIDLYVHGRRDRLHDLRKKLAGYGIDHIELTKLVAYMKLLPTLRRVEQEYYEETVNHDRDISASGRVLDKSGISPHFARSDADDTGAGDILVFKEPA